MSALAALAIPRAAAGQAVSERSPLYPRPFDPSTFRASSAELFTTGYFRGKTLAGFEQDAFFPLKAKAGAHVLVGTDPQGNLVWSRLGATHQLGKSMEGGATLFLPSNSADKPVLNAGLKTALAKTGIKVKFTAGLPANAQLGLIRTTSGLTYRIAGGLGKSGSKSADASLSWEKPSYAFDVGVTGSRKSLPKGSLMATVGRRNLAVSGTITLSSKSVPEYSVGLTWTPGFGGELKKEKPAITEPKKPVKLTEGNPVTRLGRRK